MVFERKEYFEKIFETVFRLQTTHSLGSGFDLTIEVFQKTRGSRHFTGLERQKHHRFGKDIPEPPNNLSVPDRGEKMDGVLAKEIKSFHENFQGSGMENIFEARIQDLIFPDSFSPYRKKEVEILHDVKMASLMRNTLFFHEAFHAGMAVGNDTSEDIPILP